MRKYGVYGINSITLNKTNFDSSGGIKPKVSKLMMPSIFNNTSIEVPNDFSMLLTKENVQDYLNALSMQIKLSVK